MNLINVLFLALAILQGLALARSLGKDAKAGCPFTLSVSGFDNPVGLLPDGQFSVSVSGPASIFLIDPSTGGLNTTDGAGCTVTETTPLQLRCLQDTRPSPDLSIDADNALNYGGKLDFYACVPAKNLDTVVLTLEPRGTSCDRVTIQSSDYNDAYPHMPGSEPGHCAKPVPTPWNTGRVAELETAAVTVFARETGSFQSEPPEADFKRRRAAPEHPQDTGAYVKRQVDDDSTWTLAPFAYDEASYMKKWKGLPDGEKIGSGGFETFPVEFGSSLIKGVTQFYGCTLMFIVSRKWFSIGHYPQQLGRSCPLETATGTRTHMIENWLEGIVHYDIESPNGDLICDDVFIIIVGRVDRKDGGVPTLINYLVDDQLVPEENIRYLQYFRAAGAPSDESVASPSGTGFVEWTSSDENSAAVGVYASSIEPRLWVEFRKGSDGAVRHAVSWGYAVAP